MRHRPTFTKKATLRLMLFWALLLSPTYGQEAPTSIAEPPGVARLWVEEVGTVTPEVLEKTMSDLAAQNPEQIVVLIHGYEMGAEESSGLFDTLARQLRGRMMGQRVGVVGVQWDSSQFSFNPMGAYYGRLAVSRGVGRGAVRQLLLSVQEAYPDVPISIMAHSMGCEIALSAVAPEITYPDHPPTVETFQPGQTIELAMAVFVGSDLDYDVWYESGAEGLKWFERVRLTWETLSDPLDRGDRVLSLRARFRGKAAGSLFPRMTLEQLDKAVSERRLHLDNMAVPPNHALDSYLDDRRVARIVSALRYMTLRDAPEPKELAELTGVLASPDDLGQLKAMLDSPNAGGAFYALWRIERLLCGDARHLTDGTIHRAVLSLVDNAKMIWREQATSSCLTLRRGIFPTPLTMDHAGAPERARPHKWKLPKE